jgi:Uma2 family endonuclease
MSTAIDARLEYTPEDLLSLADGKDYELVDGRLVERKMGIESSWVGSRLLARLERYSEEHRLGWAFASDAGYQCFPHRPSLVRRPDVSFVKAERFPGGMLPKGWAKISPDLAVEVVSPNDTVYGLEEKLGDYRSVEVPLVWVINPDSRTAMVYRRDGSIRLLLEDDEFSGEDDVPGFRCPLREILPPMAPKS